MAKIINVFFFVLTTIAVMSNFGLAILKSNSSATDEHADSKMATPTSHHTVVYCVYDKHMNLLVFMFHVFSWSRRRFKVGGLRQTEMIADLDCTDHVFYSNQNNCSNWQSDFQSSTIPIYLLLVQDFYRVKLAGFLSLY